MSAVADILAGTDAFIATLAELREGLDEARAGIDVFEREMREFREALAEMLRDSSQNRFENHEVARG